MELVSQVSFSSSVPPLCTFGKATQIAYEKLIHSRLLEKKRRNKLSVAIRVAGGASGRDHLTIGPPVFC